MISRKTALDAGKKLNAIADGKYSIPSIKEAVRVANAVMYQYYLIPRAIREEYFREELMADGVRMCDSPEE